MLQVESVDVRFGGVQALADVSLCVDSGSLVGLIGPNGAGKTTLFNVITGLEMPARGRVVLDGRDVTRLPPHRRARLGLGRTFQRIEVFSSLSVRDNVLAAAEARRSWGHDEPDPARTATDVLERVGLADLAGERVDGLSTGLLRLVEVARALASRPSLLLLDEPGSGLDGTESEALGTLLLDLVSDGVAILLVEHDVELVMRVCQQLHVLDFGRVIASGTPSQVRQNAAVQAAYLGADAGVVHA
ncbi:MAG: ABC-type branched-chain amino acid transport system, ATPase component [Frankiales bacterium]|nr:ABC-type branched-chain amino acid transport system, ATPase component [Frankiales bacterium]